jgi:hypothetical protein
LRENLAKRTFAPLRLFNLSLPRVARKFSEENLIVPKAAALECLRQHPITKLREQNLKTNN